MTDTTNAARRMQDHELDAYLNGVEATDEQRAAVHAAWDTLYARYWDDEDGLDPDCHEAFTAAVAAILDDETPKALETRYYVGRIEDLDFYGADTREEIEERLLDQTFSTREEAEDYFAEMMAQAIERIIREELGEV